MPFKSDKQRKFMYAVHPDIAKKWSKHVKENVYEPLAMQRIQGGLSSGYDPRDFNQDELMKGIHIELEHTKDIATAMEIAMDHLTENPTYYSDMEGCPKLENAYCCVDPRHDPEEPWDPDKADKVKHSLPFAQASIHTGR